MKINNISIIIIIGIILSQISIPMTTGQEINKTENDINKNILFSNINTTTYYVDDDAESS